MAKSYEWVFAPVLPVMATLEAGAAADGQAETGSSTEQLADVQALIAQGDAAMRTAKYAEALRCFRAAHAQIFRVLYPRFDVHSYVIDPDARLLPASADIERNLLEASAALLSVVRPEAVARQPPLVHHPDVAIDDKLAALTRTGFREALDDDVVAQIASDNGIDLLANGKPDQALVVMEQALKQRLDVDPALIGALELNLSGAALQVGDAEKGRAYSQRALKDFEAGKDGIGTAQALHASAIAAVRLGDQATADRLFAQAAEALQRALPDAGVRGVAAPAVARGPSFERPNDGVVRAEAGSIGDRVSRDSGVLDPIAQKDSRTVTLRLPGRADGWAAIVLDDELQRRELVKPWSVGVRFGGELAELKIAAGARDGAAALSAALYTARTTKERFADIRIRFDGVASTASHLTHLYAYVLPVKIGDAYSALGQYQQAEESYLQAAGYSYLNRHLEGPVLWTRLARNALEWGHARYKGGNLSGAKEQYSKLITETGTVPASYLYSTSALADPVADARTLIENLLTRPLPAVNWEIAQVVLEAHQFQQQIVDGLDFYGLALSPIHTFEYLQGVARGFAQEAIQAEREYVNFKSRQEGEEATRRDLESAVAMAAAEALARQQQYEAARDDEAAARTAVNLAVKRRDDAVAQRNAYASSSWAQIWAQAAASALGGGEDAMWAEISELADRLDRGETISGPGPKLAAAELLSAGRKTRAYELQKMDDNIAELTAAITLAQNQLAAATHRTAAAEIAMQAAQQRAAMAMASLDAFEDEFFTPEAWDKMAEVMRDISRSYLFRAIRIAQLMERAYNFENDADLHVIKDDYGHGVANPQPGRDTRLLGGDSLLQDIDSFTYHAVTTKTRKVSRIKDVISVSADFPAQFEAFRQTGVLALETDLYEFDRLHAGFYGQRIEDVEVKIVGVLPEGGLNGTLALGGVTRYRRKDGSAAQRVHEVDTMALSEFTLRNDGFLYRTETGVRGLFQGFGLGTTWVMHLPRRSNPYDFRRIFDVQLVVYYTARFDPVLRTAILSAAPRPDELARQRTYGLRYDFPDAWYAFYQGGVVRFTLDRFSLPMNQTAFRTQAVTCRVVPVDGVSGAGIDLRVTGPTGAGGSATTDAIGIVSTDAAALAGLVGLDPLGEWSIEILGGAPLTENGKLHLDRVYNIQVGLEYAFQYAAEEVI